MDTFRTRRTIEFSDTDLAGVVHFSRFFVFMETAEDQFLRSLGATLTADSEKRAIGWPKVSVACDYRSPARYGDTLEIDLRVERTTARTLTYGFDFHVGERAIARGRTTSVCCLVGPEGRFEPIAVPASLLTRLGVVPGP